MKTRNGFVSNSSSSSFVVLLKCDVEDQVSAVYCEAIESCIVEQESYENASEYYKHIQERIEILNKSIKHLQNDIKEIDILKNDEVFKKYLYFQDIMQRGRLNIKFAKDEKRQIKNLIRDVTYVECYDNKNDKTREQIMKESIENEISKMECAINEMKEIIKTYNGFLKELKKTDIQGWKVFVFDEEINFSSKLKNLVNKAEDAGIAKIIYKETT